MRTPVSTGISGRAVAAALAFAALACLPAVAHGVPETWVEGGTARGFTAPTLSTSVVRTGSQGERMVLPYELMWQYGGPGFAFVPSSIQEADARTVVVADRRGPVVEIDRPAKRLTEVVPAAIAGAPWSAQRILSGLSSGNYLVSDRRGHRRVIEVTRSGDIVWQYGGIGGTPTDPGHLGEPFYATRLPDASSSSKGDTLIVESKVGGRRVLRVHTTDYREGDPNLGFGARSIRFDYGTAQAGSNFDPRFAQALNPSRSDSNILITDGDGARIIEVKPTVSNGVTTYSTVWSYTGTELAGAQPLIAPNMASRLPNGNTLIIDSGPNPSQNRVIEVDSSKRVVDEYSHASGMPAGGELAEARSAVRSSTGSLLIADQQNTRVLEVGYATHGTMTSGDIQCGAAAPKRFLSIGCAASLPSGSSLAITYWIDGQYGGVLNGPGPHALADRSGTRIAYRISVSQTRHERTPVVESVSIGYDFDLSNTGGDGGGGGGSGGGGSGTGSGTSSGSGSGSGAGGGSGNGSGSGSGSGSGLAVSGGSGAAVASLAGTGAALAAESGGVGGPRRGWLMQQVGGGGGGGSVGGASGTGGPVARAAAATGSVLGLVLLSGIYLAGASWTPVAQFLTQWLPRLTA